MKIWRKCKDKNNERMKDRKNEEKERMKIMKG